MAVYIEKRHRKGGKNRLSTTFFDIFCLKPIMVIKNRHFPKTENDGFLSENTIFSHQKQG